MEQAIRLGLLGLGTVGSGVVNVLTRNCHEISRRAGRDIIVKSALVKDLDKSRACPTADIQLTTEPSDLLDDPEIDIIVELMGGTTIPHQLVLQAIACGKHVVTANKSLIAQFGNAIFNAAREHGIMVAFEASVAGGIPIIKALREGLSANHIRWMAGIVNGTANFILSKMHNEQCDLEDALKLAQTLGFAELDPTLDVEGYDAAHKLTILASIAFGIPLSYKSVFVEGITQITREDVAFAQELGYRIKHLAIARRGSEGIELRVHPVLIPADCLLANVNGETNAILVHGDAAGPSLYYGLGAGSEPTASAVIADVIDVTRILSAEPHHHVPYLAFQADALAQYPIIPMGNIVTANYLCLKATDRPGMLGEITTVLGERGISIEAALQKGANKHNDTVPIVIVTHPVREESMIGALEQIRGLAGVQDDVQRIRIEYLDSDTI